MKKLFTKIALLLSLAFVFTSCSEKEDMDADKITKQKAEQAKLEKRAKVLKQFTQEVALKTYADLKVKAEALFKASKEIKADDAASIKKAADAWVAARLPWEQSEGFLFGPVVYHNLDPLLDSWPLELPTIQQQVAGKHALTASHVKDNLNNGVRGFHTVEYLLFRDGKARSSMAVREKEFLSSLAEALRDDCFKLWAAWNGTEGITGADKTLAEALEIEFKSPFAWEVMNAGKAGSRFKTQKDVIEQIFDGMIGIADEVGNGKIGAPHKSGKKEEVESWYSFNSKIDFVNNIHSIKNAYLGAVGADSENSIAALVKETNKDGDEALRKLITESIAAIEKIGGSKEANFRDNLEKGNSNGDVAKAIKLIGTDLMKKLEEVKAALLKKLV